MKTLWRSSALRLLAIIIGLSGDPTLWFGFHGHDELTRSELKRDFFFHGAGAAIAILLAWSYLYMLASEYLSACKYEAELRNPRCND